ncbi:vitamin K epoxide reductase family protein [Flavobacterium sinopsychrotolerans]|uniref:Vitamin K epoxide reductase family protein n=1 Tax=Flavobacterium sinopsychrotolerans TaxID=604089 RepID=A0A1H8Q7V3_9FLAO|nr:vitamin K epoxide reductase family protein [Flavobacterium sinopsychrotolerans]SEO50108.1 Vitamin K epoxide reductase family protein [Flavobacterium sinopsychrotolerans]
MINIVKKYLEINQFSDLKSSFEDLFLSHPNYPSVFAITDSLDMLSIENVAMKVPKEQLLELPDSFLAIFNQDLVLVSKTEKNIVVDIEKGENKILTIDDFSKDWNGIIVAIEPNETISSHGFKINSKWIKYGLPVIGLLVLSIIYNKYSFSNLFQLIVSTVGLVCSIFIIQEKLGFKNHIVSKLCDINPNTSCDSVIKSDIGDINRWFSFSDLPLIFFGVNVLAIAIQPTDSSKIVGILSLFALPIIAYSFWLQKVQLKKWCILCLIVSSLIISQGVLWFFVEQPLDVTFPNFFSYLFSLILVPSIWVGIKPVLENKIKLENEITELKKFKRNYDVFNFLLKEIPVVKGFDLLEGLKFGNRNSEVSLTLLLSPSCGHCHKAFQDAFELVSKFPQKVFLNVLFNINPENNDNPYKVVVESLLAINNSNLGNMEEAISDWHIQKIGLEKWVAKWKIGDVPMRVNHQIEQQYNWCLENEFNYTPVKIVNGKLFPKEYEISELKYFLNDFSEDKEYSGINILVEA